MKFKEIKEEKIFNNKDLNIYKKSLVLPNEKEVSWTFLKGLDGVGVIAIDGEQVILVKQYRPAISKTIIELPGGRVEEGQTPLEAAKIELLEETGYKAKEWKEIVTLYASPGFSDTRFHLFLAKDLIEWEPCPEPTEFIEIIHQKLNELDQLEIEDMRTILGINYIKTIGG